MKVNLPGSGSGMKSANETDSDSEEEGCGVVDEEDLEEEQPQMVWVFTLNSKRAISCINQMPVTYVRPKVSLSSTFKLQDRSKAL